MAITHFRGRNYYLSNMYPFQNGIETPDGVKVRTSEQLYLSSRLMQGAARLVVQRAEDGFTAKKLFNALKESGSPTIPDWENAKIEHMRKSVAAKFIANPPLARKLIETEDQEIIEGNDRGDTFWGVSPPPPIGGTGQNNLGRLLMETREKLNDPEFAGSDPQRLVVELFEPVLAGPKVSA